MISGARYSSVPTKELARASGSATSRYVVGSWELCMHHCHMYQLLSWHKADVNSVNDTMQNMLAIDSAMCCRR